MRDFKREYTTIEPRLEPQDFIRIHEDDLAKLLRMLREVYDTASDRNFTDRSDWENRIGRLLPPNHSLVWS